MGGHQLKKSHCEISNTYSLQRGTNADDVDRLYRAVCYSLLCIR